jgi:hypothetical protein
MRWLLVGVPSNAIVNDFSPEELKLLEGKIRFFLFHSKEPNIHRKIIRYSQTSSMY